MLFQKPDSNLVFRLWAEIEIAGLAGCRPLPRFVLCPPRPSWNLVSHFAVVAFIAMIFIQGAHGLSKNLCADARSLAGDYGKRKAERPFIFGLTFPLLPCSQAVRWGVDGLAGWTHSAGPYFLG